MAGTIISTTIISTTIMAATIMAATIITITYYYNYYYYSYYRNMAPAYPSHRILQLSDFVLYLEPGLGEVLEN